MQLLVHLLVELVSYIHIIFEMPLGLRLRLLESHRHKFFVGLRFGTFVSLALFHGLYLKLQFLDFFFHCQITMKSRTVVIKCVIAPLTVAIIRVGSRRLHLL